MRKEIKLAVLIDGDNIPSKYIKEMMEEISKYGSPTVKRIYGDWTKPQLSKWKNVLLENAINPIQQYSYTQGKNATDSAMIIDAMDILYSEKVDGFCIASSDSDFTKLATRLREAGLLVYGIGEKKTPEPFIVACDKFIYLEILHKEEDDSTNKSKPNIDKITPKVMRLLKTTVADTADDDGWAFMGDVGSLLLKKQSNFDPRNFGYEKLTPLFEGVKGFEIERRVQENSRFKLVYVKNK
ncbi:OST-HTH/LOTUS domain-containing protein [Lishizhenia tianjinensis]|uniref:OST-HTH/LOTUS domain-containing protein n=1 Tax=Lishizhenia tianjinensis TaxID=477690 RepID=A0A1I7B5C8_9FLAO|nr:NYN domain-containing protein [Lishizhenia tianjinensis]SFT82377.1 OST-HTH/LOTUS domain-containing protein [Lishizhenia tianjinensis]